MTLAGKPVIWLVLALTALVGMGTCVGQQRTQQTKIKTMMEAMEKEKRTVCVGRFLIDLPANARITHWGQWHRSGTSIYLTPHVTHEQFKAQIAKRIEDLSTSKNRQGESYLDRVVYMGISDGLIIYYRDDNWKKDPSAKGDVYYWFGGTLLQAHYEDVPLDEFDGIAKNWTRRFLEVPMRALSETEIPYEPGFCMNASFAPGAPKPGEPHSESVEIQFGLTDRPDVQFRLSMMTNHGSLSDPLLARNQKNNAYEMFPGAFKALRKRQRGVNGMQGDEIAERVTEDNGTRFQSFDWEAQGKLDDVRAPQILLEMKTGWQPGGTPKNSSLTDDEALAIWDAILNTLRLRPESPPPQSSRGDEPTLIRPAIPLGMRLPSGAYCPQAGTWVCESPEPRVQSFAKGDLLPTVRTEDRKWLRTRVKDHAVIWTLRQYAEESGNG